ncbi:MAG TPA: mandelate racemase/muconate lactonizing enzyme family protein [Chloroflexota bacterium]|jgi:L-alanine-DL-glutamate epimerase-like enolase superfamily enzyme|nr:mandelate racemase/muconate lactonizing enzyme family protein [Chloroflexota bacterium]
MRITAVETITVDGGTHPWQFCAVRTDEGITGYSEIGTEAILNGVEGLVRDFGERLVGRDPGPIERIYTDLYRLMWQAPYGATLVAIGGIELALWDVKGKALGVPVHALCGGPTRDRQRVYWSHLASARVRHHALFGVRPVRTLADVADCAREAVEKGFSALKTNIIHTEDAPGAAANRSDRVVTTARIRQAVRQIAAIREAVGPDVDVCLDVGNSIAPQDAIRLAAALEPYDLFWLEVDNQDPGALGALRAATSIPITSGETLQTPRQFLPFFQARALDTAMIDVRYQGFAESRRVADLAAVYDLNVAPHNFNGHLCTFQSLHLTASIANVRIMEFDQDAAPWRDELFTHVPEIVDGEMRVPQRPGWGTDLREDVARSHPWRGGGRG